VWLRHGGARQHGPRQPAICLRVNVTVTTMNEAAKRGGPCLSFDPTAVTLIFCFPFHTRRWARKQVPHVLRDINDGIDNASTSRRIQFCVVQLAFFPQVFHRHSLLLGGGPFLRRVGAG
jgi:hypothetical protein